MKSQVHEDHAEDSRGYSFGVRSERNSGDIVQLSGVSTNPQEFLYTEPPPMGGIKASNARDRYPGVNSHNRNIRTAGAMDMHQFDADARQIVAHSHLG